MVSIYAHSQNNLSYWSKSLLNHDTLSPSIQKLSVLKWELLLVYECYKKSIYKALQGFCELRFCREENTKKGLFKILNASVLSTKVTLLFFITLVSKEYGARAFDKFDLYTKYYTQVSKVKMQIGDESPLEFAKKETKNELGDYQTVVVCPPYNSLLPKNLIYFPGVSFSMRADAFKRAYRVLFQTANEIGINGILVVPCNNNHLAASYAVKCAFNYAIDTTRIVRFVILPEDGPQAENIQAIYDKAITDYFQDDNMIEKTIYRKQIQISQGRLEAQECEAIAIPVGINFTYPGFVSSVIEEESKKKINPPVNQSITDYLHIVDLLPVIFQKLDLKSLGRAFSACKIFKNTSESAVLWKVFAEKIRPDPFLQPYASWKEWVINHRAIWFSNSKIDFANKTLHIHDMDTNIIPFLLGHISGKVTCLYSSNLYSSNLLFFRGDDVGFYRDESGVLVSWISPDQPQYSNYLLKKGGGDASYRHFKVIECSYLKCKKSVNCENLL
jgi:hypothetical protein